MRAFSQGWLSKSRMGLRKNEEHGGLKDLWCFSAMTESSSSVSATIKLLKKDLLHVVDGLLMER